MTRHDIDVTVGVVVLICFLWMIGFVPITSVQLTVILVCIVTLRVCVALRRRSVPESR